MCSANKIGQNAKFRKYLISDLKAFPSVKDTVPRQAAITKEAPSIPVPGQDRERRRRGFVSQLLFVPRYGSMRVPSTWRKAASHFGWAGQAGAVTSLPAVQASSTATSAQVAPARRHSGPTAG